MSESPTTSTYQIAPAFAGQTFVHDDLSAPVTANNLTDELAEFFIKHGRKDAFIKRGAQLEPGNSTEADAEPDSALAAEKDAHKATKAKGAEALKAEKEAHKATKKELTEVSKQLAEAQKKLAELADKAGAAEGDATGTE